MFGGAMVGPQFAVFMQKLGTKLDRVVNFHLYVPSPTMKFPGIEEFLKTYQARATDAGHRSARLLPAAFCLRGHAGARAGGQGHRHAR